MEVDGRGRRASLMPPRCRPARRGRRRRGRRGPRPRCAGAPGVSPWMQIVCTRPEAARSTACRAATTGSVCTAPGRALDRSDPSGFIGSIGEPLGHRRQAGCLRRLEQTRIGEPDHDHGPSCAHDRPHDRLGQRGIGRRFVVQGAMDLDVAQSAAHAARHSRDRLDLLDKALLERVRGHLEVVAPEAGAIGIARVGADGSASLPRELDRLPDGRLVAGVRATGDVDGTDHGDQRGILTSGKSALPLPRVAVQLDAHGLMARRRDQARRIGRAGRRRPGRRCAA